MSLKELAQQLGRRITIQSEVHGDGWMAYIDSVGFSSFGWVTVVRHGKTPEDAMKDLAEYLSGEELCVDGNTDRKRYFGPFTITQ